MNVIQKGCYPSKKEQQNEAGLLSSTQQKTKGKSALGAITIQQDHHQYLLSLSKGQTLPMDTVWEKITTTIEPFNSMIYLGKKKHFRCFQTTCDNLLRELTEKELISKNSAKKLIKIYLNALDELFDVENGVHQQALLIAIQENASSVIKKEDVVDDNTMFSYYAHALKGIFLTIYIPEKDYALNGDLEDGLRNASSRKKETLLAIGKLFKCDDTFAGQIFHVLQKKWLSENPPSLRTQ